MVKVFIFIKLSINNRSIEKCSIDCSYKFKYKMQNVDSNDDGMRSIDENNQASHLKVVNYGESDCSAEGNLTEKMVNVFIFVKLSIGYSFVRHIFGHIYTNYSLKC